MIQNIKEALNFSWKCGWLKLKVRPKKAKFVVRYFDYILRLVKILQVNSTINAVNKMLVISSSLLTKSKKTRIFSWICYCTQHRPTLRFFNSVALTRYEKNFVDGTVHRIKQTTSNWQIFRDGIEKTKNGNRITTIQHISPKI